MKKALIANDHAGVELKRVVVSYLAAAGYETHDVGCHDTQRVDYPDYAKVAAEFVQANPQSFSILICGTGIGMSIAANKFSGVRAALCHDAYTAAMARAHNDANVLCIGSRVVGAGVAESIVGAWLNTAFEGGRHGDRIAKIHKAEA